MYLVKLDSISEFSCPFLTTGFAGMKRYLELTGIKTYNSNGYQNTGGSIEKTHYVNLEDLNCANLLKSPVSAGERYSYQNASGPAFKTTWHDWMPVPASGLTRVHGYVKFSGVKDGDGNMLAFTLPGTMPGFKESIEKLGPYGGGSFYTNSSVRYIEGPSRYCRISRTKEKITITNFYGSEAQASKEILKESFPDGVVPLFVIITMTADGGKGGNPGFMTSGSGGGGGGTITAILNLISGDLYFGQLSDWHTYLSNNSALSASNSLYGYARVNRGEDGTDGSFGTSGGLGGECYYSGQYDKFLIKLSDARLADKDIGKGGTLLKASNQQTGSRPDNRRYNVTVYCFSSSTQSSDIPSNRFNGKISRTYSAQVGAYTNTTKDGGVGGPSAISDGGNNSGGNGSYGSGGGGKYVDETNNYNGGYGVIYLQY